MIRLISFLVLFLSLLTGCLFAGNFLLASENGSLGDSWLEDEDRLQLWNKVQSDQQNRLPKSAIAGLKEIQKSAVADEAWPEATLALCSRFLIEGQVNQPVYPYVIKQLRVAIPDAPEQMKPVLKTMLAEYFFMYYQQNRWRFQQRSQTASEPGDDFAMWDLARLLGEIDKLFTEALASKEDLQKIPIATYDKLLTKGNVSDEHRPTLYDFLAFRALQFYSLDEQFIRQQDAFQVGADSPIFAATAEFLRWNPETTDDDSYQLKAVALLQELLQSHALDKDPTAYLDAELMRLRFGRSIAKGEEANVRYRAALKRFCDQNVTHPLSSIALASLAMAIKADESDFVEAKKFAEQGIARFPNSIGAKQCQNVLNEIETKFLNIVTERVWNGDDVRVDVRYQNVNKVWFRLVEFDYRNWKDWGRFRTPQRSHNENMKAILNSKTLKEWSVELPSTDDFKPRTESILVDKDKLDLKSGCYILLSSNDGTFDQATRDEKYKSISMAEVWISKLAMIARRSVGESQFEVQVVNAIDGKPLEGVTVESAKWIYAGRNSRPSAKTTATTDANGFVIFKNKSALMKLDITHGDQTFGVVENTHNGRYSAPTKHQRTVFFTDRSIYRPGQTIQFKGICYQSNQITNEYSTRPGKTLTVRLYDANNQEVEKKQFTTNEFGSFSGSFTAPRDRVTGMMRLHSSIAGTARIRVEEYKRPKFFTEIDKPTEAFQLGQKVKITGNATAYTGAAVDGSKVVWRVVRTVRYPTWWSYRYWYVPQRGDTKEIANGEMKTDANGKFEIEFTAEPDESIDRESEPVFTYQVFADVTDTAGETRSASQTTSVGYTSLQAKLSAEQWLTTDEEIELSLSITTVDGEGQKSSGVLKIFELTPPEKVQRVALGNRYRWGYNPKTDTPDLSKINAWPTGAIALERELSTDDSGETKTTIALKAGAFKAVFETTDPAGNKVRTEVPLLVNDFTGDKFATKIPHFFQTKQKSVEPGEEFVAVWGTGYDSGRAFVELEHRGKVLKSYWTNPNATQHVIKFPIEEKHRGGIQLRITYVHENRLYPVNQPITVPWSNKKLTVKWEHFVSKLQPGGRETWTAVVSGPNAEKTVSEMVAGMYDASLDAFNPHQWIGAFNAFYRNYTSVTMRFYNFQQSGRQAFHSGHRSYRDARRTYRSFANLTGLDWQSDYWTNRNAMQRMQFRGRGFLGGGEVPAMEMADTASAPAPNAAGMGLAGRSMSKGQSNSSGVETDAGGGTVSSASSGSKVDLKSVSPRKNLQETAFFYPNLKVDDDGSVRIEFEIPEALTKWKFMGFAHDNELRSALLTDEMTTSKDLMVQPNPPRFLREGDLLEFSVKVSNQSDDPQTGSVRLTFADARTAKSVDAAFGNQQLDQTFEIPARQSTSLYWKIKVPDFVGALTYKAIGATEKVSDGEEGFLPVLSKRILVTESLPLPIRGNQTKTFDFERLKLSGKSDTLQNQTLTVQMTSNPSWYAVMSLPYLMEYQHQCSEQTFNRLYANTLGHHIVSSDPKIERIFDQWRGTDALNSPLEKNDELRNILIAESPWLKAGKKESQARRDVGVLFDKNRMTAETKRSLDRLKQMQLSDGAWPWFPGGRANDYITLYVTTGFGRLRHLGTTVDVSPAIRSLDRLDWWINKQYEAIRNHGNLKENNLSQSICLYLYGRSFFLNDKPVDDKYKTAFDYFVGQAKKHWVDLNNRQSQGHVAIALKRLGDPATPTAIMKSLTERSLQEDEMGMFWREGDRSWWWYKAPIETQALMIEAYDEVAGDKAKVEELKIWLLKQKQTQNWKTTKATADACYGLLLRGTDLLASDKLVSVKLGGLQIKPEKIEAGTGFYEQKFVRGEIRPEMGQIEMVKSDDGIAWGSVHWQYLEDVSKIEPYEGTPLTLKKSLYTKKNSEKGPVISEVKGPVEVGDELVMRVELRVDRAMEYVHLKDYRGSGTEPVNVLSRYKFQDGLAYYESTKDTASHFFIDYLPRGTYVFEYSVRVQHRGVYETGIAELQCMYAPEFNSHSGSVEITVE